MKLDFGSGTRLKPEYEGVDLYAPDAKYKIDLFSFPLPWENESVEEINMSHFLEHVPKEKRWPLFEECYRILVPKGQIFITVPNWKSERAYGDNGHEWPPVTTMTFCYLNKNWRQVNQLEYGVYKLTCDFDFNTGASNLMNGFEFRGQEAQMFACMHYTETFMDLWCVLTKK
jgi:predicted SAM-dependent methyltransferase